MMDFDDRSTFIMLDILAKKRGGSANLTTGEKIDYVFCGIKAGFLTIEEAYELAKKLSVDSYGVFNVYFKDLQKQK